MLEGNEAMLDEKGWEPLAMGWIILRPLDTIPFGGDGKMSPKELLYIEDALDHEKFLQTQCQQAAQALQNAELKAYVDQLAQQHTQLFQKFYGLV